MTTPEDTAATITAEDLRTCKLREAAHGHGTGMFFYLMRCVEHPRLTRYDFHDRKKRTVKSTWRVDGEDVSDFEAAIVRLNQQPILTAEERAILETVPDEPMDLRTREDRYEPAFGTARAKGFIAVENKMFSRTQAGRDALKWGEP